MLNSAFWNRSNFSRCCNFFALDLNFKRKIAFCCTKIYNKCKFQRKSFSSNNLRQDIGAKLTKWSRIGFSRIYFPDILQFSSTSIKIFHLGDQLGTRFQFQEFQWFSWNFRIPKILSYKSWSNSWSNRFFYLLVITV